MTEPNWIPLGSMAAVVDYVGGWSAGVAYVPGNVVRYNGVDYLAVNPSTGQTPPGASLGSFGGVGTILPASPVDGMEAILVDSLTAPTYQWLFRYMATISDAYKWVFIGSGALQQNADAAAVLPTNQSSYVTLTGGPIITLPRAGLYIVDSGFTPTVFTDAGGGPGGIMYMSFDIGATLAVDADCTQAHVYSTSLASAFMSSRIKTFPIAGTILTSKYRINGYGTNVTWTKRWLRATPVRVS